MHAVLIPTDGMPHRVEVEVDQFGSALRGLQRLVGGNIDVFDALWEGSPSLYVNDEGLYECEANRCIVATREMEQAGYLNMFDFRTPAKEGRPFTVLFGDIVALGLDPETGEDRDVTPEEADKVCEYFSSVQCGPGSGALQLKCRGRLLR